MEFLEKHMKFIILIFGFISTVGGALIAVDGRYAKAEDHAALEVRVSIGELKTQLRAALDEYYFLKKQLRAHPDDEDIKEKVAEAKEHINDLKEAIKSKKD